MEFAAAAKRPPALRTIDVMQEETGAGKIDVYWNWFAVLLDARARDFGDFVWAATRGLA